MRLAEITLILVFLTLITVIGILSIHPGQDNMLIALGVIGCMVLGFCLLMVYFKIAKVIEQNETLIELAEENNEAINKYLNTIVVEAVGVQIWDQLQERAERNLKTTRETD